MSDSKRLVVNLSEVLYKEFNKALEEDSKNKSQFIREAIILYIEQKKKMNIDRLMKEGYADMAKLNLEISEMGLADDLVELREYEVNLSECDLPNDDSSEKRRYILC